MKLEKFKEIIPSMPYKTTESLDLVLLAEHAKKISDNPNISNAAKNFLKAYDDFNSALEKIHITVC